MGSDTEYNEESPKRKRGRLSNEDKLPKPKVSPKKSDEDLDGFHYACSVCEQVFLHKANYLRHIQRHEPPGGFLCTICVQPFTTDWDRNRHKREEHSVFRCRLCKAEFPAEDDYNGHIQSAHAGRDRDYDVCPTCGQQFRTASQLKVHIESKCGTEKKHECEECHSRYLTQASLNAHMIKHAGVKSHLCNYCGASFLNKGQLKVHERMHTGERPYKCNQCDKAFAHRESLITHSTTHSGIKPYYCSYCQNRFSCIGNLLKHRRARADTCGLPQYCQTNKIVARPNIKTMPNLTDRQVYTNKVIQRVSRLKVHKIKAETSVEKPDPPKKSIAKQVARPAIPAPSELDESDDFKHFYDDFEQEADYEPKVNVKPNRKTKSKPSKYGKLVDLQVELGDDDTSIQTSILAKSTNDVDGDENIEFFEVKLETLQDTDDLIVEEHEVAYDVADDEQYQIAQASTFDDSNDNSTEPMNVEVLQDNQPPVEHVFRRVFTEKPPVITNFVRRGRPRMPKQEKQPMVRDDVILVDIEEQKRQIEEQRAIFEAHVEQRSVDCYQCGLCPSQYTTSYLIGRHLDRDHGIVLQQLNETLRYDRVFTKDRKYKCKYCLRLYVNEKALEKHLLLHGPNGTALHKCVVCTTFYETEELAQEHAMIEHRERLECPICFRFFTDHERMTKHLKNIHQGEKKKQEHVCLKCGKSFSSRTVVADHERANCGQNPLYPCEHCGKFLNSANSLRHHYSVHTDDLPFSCQFCGKNYRTKGQVKVHERTHTGEKPYACDFCPKRFGHRETLYTHRSLHTGIKRYMCSGCGMRYTCVSNLQAHRRSHKTTCGLVPTVSKPKGPDGVHELPEGYELPFPIIADS